MLGWGGIASLTFIKLSGPYIQHKPTFFLFVGKRTQTPAYAPQLMSLMGLAEQTYVSCSRMWIPKAKTEEPRILGEEKQKDDRVESDSISPPVPIAIASWGCVSGPCILQLSSGISYSPVLYSESRTQPFT